MIIKRFTMAGNRMQKKIDLVQLKILSKTRSPLFHNFLSKPNKQTTVKKKYKTKDLS